MLCKLGRIPVPWSGFCLLSRQAGWVETVRLVLYEMRKPAESIGGQVFVNNCIDGPTHWRGQWG